MVEQALDITKMPGGPAPRAENYVDDLAVIERIEQASRQAGTSLYIAMNNWTFSRAKACKGDEYDSLF